VLNLKRSPPLKVHAMPSITANLRALLGFIALPLILSLAAAKATLGLPEKSNHRTSASQGDFVQFPARSLGLLCTLEPDWSPVGTFPNGEAYSQAQGRVAIGRGLILKFIPNLSLCQHGDILSEFPLNTLQVLDLSRLELTDDFLAKLGKLHTLRALSLEDTELDDERLKKLGDLTNLQVLNISKCLIKGPGLRYLTASRDLRKLQYDFADLGPDFGENLTQFPKLTCLFLVHSRLKNNDLSSLGKLKSLEHLKITSNSDITDSGIEKLASLKHLRCLEVDNTHVTPPGLLALKGAPLKLICIDGRYKTSINLVMLKKAFPAAEIVFRESHANTSIPPELYAPLH
jgi:hypothetical protein